MFGVQLKQLRQANRLSQVQLARSLGVSKQSVSNWENDNLIPSVELVIKLSQFFSVPTDWLLGLEQRKYIEVTGLTEEEIAHLQMVIWDITKKRDTNGL